MDKNSILWYYERSVATDGGGKMKEYVQALNILELYDKVERFKLLVQGDPWESWTLYLELRDQFPVTIEAIEGFKPSIESHIDRTEFYAKWGQMASVLSDLWQTVEEHNEIRLSQPMFIDAENRLVIDLNNGFPAYDQGMEEVKRFLILRAVALSQGNRSAAARLLQASRSKLHDLWHQLHGKPIRPPKNKAGDESPPE